MADGDLSNVSRMMILTLPWYAQYVNDDFASIAAAAYLWHDFTFK